RVAAGLAAEGGEGFGLADWAGDGTVRAAGGGRHQYLAGCAVVAVGGVVDDVAVRVTWSLWPTCREIARLKPYSQAGRASPAADRIGKTSLPVLRLAAACGAPACAATVRLVRKKFATAMEVSASSPRMRKPPVCPSQKNSRTMGSQPLMAYSVMAARPIRL